MFDFGSGKGFNYHMLFDKMKLLLSLEPDKMAQVD